MSKQQSLTSKSEITAHRNEVSLVGKISGSSTRILPSGDQISTFRIVIDRAHKDRGPSGRVMVDAIDCTAWRVAVQRAVAKLVDGDVVEVSGAMRRRFWRTGSQATSRVEVEVRKLRRIRAPKL